MSTNISLSKWSIKDINPDTRYSNRDKLQTCCLPPSISFLNPWLFNNRSISLIGLPPFKVNVTKGKKFRQTFSFSFFSWDKKALYHYGVRQTDRKGRQLGDLLPGPSHLAPKCLGNQMVSIYHLMHLHEE